MKQVMKNTALMVLLNVLTAVITVSAVAETLDTKAIDAVFAEWNRTDSPGCSIAIIRDGEIVYSRGYGMASLELGVPISPETVFYFGSESKQFVTFCLLLLEEEGKLSLDDNIRKYVPEIPDYGAQITIRHLCHHTSGLRDYFILWDIAGEDFADYHSENEVVDMLTRQKELNFMPGEQRLYCNSGFLLLSTIIRRVSGMSLPDFAEQRIFGPLGMKDTHFHDDPDLLVPHRASGHMKGSDGGWELLNLRFALVGSGGMYTCVNDLLKWDRNFYDNRLGRGGQAMIDRMTTSGRLNNGEEFGYGLALAVGEYRGLRTVRHGGALGGYRTHMLRFPSEHFTVITLFNLGNVNPAGYAEQVADICLSSRLAPKKTPAQTQTSTGSETKDTPETVTLSDKELARYAGVYHSDELMTDFSLVIEDGALVQKRSGEIVRIFECKGKDIFASSDFTLRFERAGKKRGATFRLDADRVKNLLFEKK